MLGPIVVFGAVCLCRYLIVELCVGTDILVRSGVLGRNLSVEQCVATQNWVWSCVLEPIIECGSVC